MVYNAKHLQKHKLHLARIASITLPAKLIITSGSDRLNYTSAVKSFMFMNFENIGR